MNDSNMTGTGFPNAVPQASSNRETGKKTTRSAIGAKAQTILDSGPRRRPSWIFSDNVPLTRPIPSV